jgi:hypothetical protein
MTPITRATNASVIGRGIRRLNKTDTKHDTNMPVADNNLNGKNNKLTYSLSNCNDNLIKRSRAIPGTGLGGL